MSLTYMGNTHFSVEDMGLVRNIPGMTVFSPCDAGEAVKAFEASMNMNSPVYLRLMGSLGSKAVYKDDFSFEVGKPNEIRTGNDVQILATGSMVDVALNTSDQLKEKGIESQVLDVHTLKPFDASVISKGAKLIVTVEEHTKVSGLASIVSSELAQFSSHPKRISLGLEDSYGKVGEYNWMLENRNLTADYLVNTIISNI